MAYESAGYRILEVILMLIIGSLLLIIGITLVNGLQLIYNSEIPTPLKAVSSIFTDSPVDALRYKDLIGVFSSTAFKIAKWVVDKIKDIYSFFTLVLPLLK